MPTPLTMEWRIITNGREQRIKEDHDLFEVSFEGYKLFPIDETVEIIRKPGSKQLGIAKIVKIVFESNKTTCQYQLISLQSVN
ncbi:DUF2584 family protein [Tenuibacillus multivorans]|uniref:DUF2584 domain-containing protein n=1 Tax=Tenuibacillus multivorans TaxID=237069 RepID=A0A1H0CQE6_9BACI|nr:DUF2584 family protein [Tenuibacillus multivorans]GEL76209.1 hypothetical protein TMU01_04440 [Tenuibacillus multivorans]SDN59991.1 Protein of unknown function [Tenuibacillus multivorans]